MDDFVKAAVRAAMAREEQITNCESGTLTSVKPSALEDEASKAPSKTLLRKRKRDFGGDVLAERKDSRDATTAKRKKLGRDVIPTATAVSQITPRIPETAAGVAASKPAEPKQCAKDEKKAGTKKLSSNWAALRASLPKPAVGVTKRRPRKLTPAATQVAVTAAPLACSMFVKTALRSGPAVKPTKVLALDCEFVGIGPEGRENALARASVVNSRGEILFDSFVRVEAPVVDYRTKYSGVTAEDLGSPDAADPRSARSEIAELLKGRILVGHAVYNDLRVLRIAHPKRDIRDTSDYYKKLWKKDGRRGGAPPALRLVVARVLGVDQFQNAGHDSCEDARASLALYKKNVKEWESSRGGKKAKPRR